MNQDNNPIIEIYDFDDTLAMQSIQINGQKIRLPLESYNGFCEILQIDPATRDHCLWPV